jgi:phosphocarrier protein HPr
MYTNEIEIVNDTGLHARPASDLTILCQKFKSEITIMTDDMEVNPKSIISILSAGIKKGTVITLNVSGDDEQTAGSMISNFISNLKE